MAARRLNEPIEPMTLGNMRANGVRSLDVSCWQRHHRTILSAEQSRITVPVPATIRRASGPPTRLPKSPAINHAPIVHLAIVNVPAECTAITHLVGHDPRIRIVDHELTAEHQMISKRISRDRSGGDN
jgi:hypothetical protein